MNASSIPTAGLSHLIYAFASIDPSSFAVVPANAADLTYYPAFISLKTASLQTWISVGGGSFNAQPSAATFHTWSEMTSSQASRAQFVSSLMDFVVQHGFQGVDLDWEFPTEPSRGGDPSDTANFVSLISDVRAAFGPDFGISAPIPVDYGDLAGFDLKGMNDAGIDFFNVMAYDLSMWRGPGSMTGAQTNMSTVASDAVLYWSSGVNPSKLNLGIAFYSWGYTLADPECHEAGCPASGPSLPRPCSQTSGFATSVEINSMIDNQALAVRPALDDNGAMVKEIVFYGSNAATSDAGSAEQWMAFDDAETWARKMAWADQHCFGGGTIWSIDFGPVEGAPSIGYPLPPA